MFISIYRRIDYDYYYKNNSNHDQSMTMRNSMTMRKSMNIKFSTK